MQGLPTVSRAVIHLEESKTAGDKYKLFVEGDNLRQGSQASTRGFYQGYRVEGKLGILYLTSTRRHVHKETLYSSVSDAESGSGSKGLKKDQKC